MFLILLPSVFDGNMYVSGPFLQMHTDM